MIQLETSPKLRHLNKDGGGVGGGGAEGRHQGRKEGKLRLVYKMNKYFFKKNATLCYYPSY